MSMRRVKRESQEELWIAAPSLPRSPGHPFYERLNGALREAGFDAFVEGECAPYYAECAGRPSIAPGVYFRSLFIGFFEGIGSERGIAWRLADSMALRAFCGFALTEATPEHSSFTRIRQRLPLELHQRVFTWVLGVLTDARLLRGATLGIDATTLEANAAMRSIVRRDSGDTYQEFLTDLAKASGIETPTREDLARVDKDRPGKGSNGDWTHPHDPDARITKMKDGRTHLAHKSEHAIDMDTGAIVAITVQGADQGDTATVHQTLDEAKANLAAVAQDPQRRAQLKPLRQLVGDKGYHSNYTLTILQNEHGLHTCVSEPARGRRKWKNKREEQKAVYKNRCRIRSEHGKKLLKKRGEFLERAFAHLLETGGLRRTHLRGHGNILKRGLLHTAAFNLALLMRTLTGAGTPKGLAERCNTAAACLYTLLQTLAELFRPAEDPQTRIQLTLIPTALPASGPNLSFSTGC